MKTVFVLIPSGYLVRNVLSTGILDKLASRSDIRVIALTQSPDEVMSHRQNNPRLVFEEFPMRSRYNLSNLVNRILRVRFDKINENKALNTLAKKTRVRDPASFFLDTLISQPFPRSRRIYNWIRTIGERGDGVLDEIQSLFDLYSPSLVLATNPTRMVEYPFLKYAKQTGITTVGMIKSWDVMLTKGYIPILTDYYLVWTPIMKKDLMKFHDVADEFIGVTGVPQFDIYSESIPISRRDEFLSQLGLDPRKKTILFSTSSPWIGIQEPKILNSLAQSLIENKSSQHVQILARLHPLDDPLRYEDIHHPNLVYQIPGLPTDTNDEERFLDPNYITLLRDALACSDLVINTASTMTLEAAALDKPVVNLALDLEPTDYWQSSQRYYEFEHYLPIVNSGAVKIARTLDELVAMSLRYLDAPHLEEQERGELRKMMCYKLDGRSAQRVADHLFCVLDGKPFSEVFR
jgi:CDP-glycerol glycerophosphotransferase (TagB/SpsB family)